MPRIEFYGFHNLNYITIRLVPQPEDMNLRSINITFIIQSDLQ
jgi:hypothetical protein